MDDAGVRLREVWVGDSWIKRAGVRMRGGGNGGGGGVR